LPLAYQILGNVIDYDKFNKYGSEYLYEDCENLSVEISFMLSQTQSLLSKWIRYDIKKMQDKSIPPSKDSISVKEKERENDSCERVCFFNKLDEKLKNQFVTDLLLESTKNSFNKIANDIIKLFHLHPKQLPSFYMATKHRCNMTCGVLELDTSLLFLLPKNDFDKVQKSNNADDCIGKKCKITTKYFAKITGGYNKIYELLSEKITKRFPNANQKNLLFFDSFDGANHLETTEGKVDLISHSSTCVNKYLLSGFNYSTSQSSNILT